jgi:hypothetical protein
MFLRQKRPPLSAEAVALFRGYLSVWPTTNQTNERSNILPRRVTTASVV